MASLRLYHVEPVSADQLDTLCDSLEVLWERLEAEDEHRRARLARVAQAMTEEVS